MSSTNRVFVSPGVYTSEKDISYVTKQIGVTTLGLAGETTKGPAFQPIFISAYDEFKSFFGGQNATKVKETGVVKYELPYIAKSYLTKSNQLYVTRVLGFSGYDAGKSWLITSLGSDANKVIAMLKNSGVEVEQLKSDTTIDGFVDYVSDITYAHGPYEGHFPHSEFTLTRTPVKEHFLKGDYVINTRQKCIRYILEALEADCTGSFFRWNFFDTHLQQKEWFSSYIFEEKAIDFLNENPLIKAEFEALKSNDAAFSKDAFAQLYWVYRKSPFYEKEHMRIPVFRVF
mgnify:CR=1 FL=1